MATPATTTTTTSPATLNADTSQGTTTINDGVVAKIAGIAAREVPGVYDLGGGAARALGAIRSAINAQDHSQGISVEVGETQAAADVTLIAEYPVSLQRVADDVRDAIVTAVESLVGLQVTEVNVTIADIHLPTEDRDEDASADARVQ